MDSFAPPEDGTIRRRLIGVVDIGSNTVRLVVFDGARRTPIPIFNEKATCALGADLETTGLLNPLGKILALAAMDRFALLARAMEVERLDVVATAACRDASDGAAFIGEIERRCRLKVTLLSGEEEAMRSALGVMCAVPELDGIVCDLGGGSLEIVEAMGGKTGLSASLPLGVLRLQDIVEKKSPGAVLSAIEGRLDGVSFLAKGKGRALYVVGGSWRSLARVLIDHMAYPLHVLDNFTISFDQALPMVSLIARQSPKSLEKVAGVSRRRLAALPTSAQVLESLLRRIKPSALVFSVYGMREGQYFLSMPEDMRQGDPLLSAAADLARAAGRFPEHARELMEWMSPLFPDESAHLQRMRHAACLLGDIFWNEHPDYRAEQAFLRVLRLPFMGLSHIDRAALALAVYFRYASEETSSLILDAQSLLSEARVKRLRVVGVALRLGHAMSGGIPGILSRTKLRQDGKRLILDIPQGDPVFLPELFARRMDRLGSVLGMETEITSA